MSCPRGCCAIDHHFWRHVEVADGCWLWTGRMQTDGYGQPWMPELDRFVSAHRYSYEHAVGPIPDGLELDHLCRVRACVRPDHLEPVTKYENFRRGESPQAQNLRKTSCPRGHEYSEANTWHYRGSRYCRECRRVEARERKRRNREVQRVLS